MLFTALTQLKLKLKLMVYRNWLYVAYRKKTSVILNSNASRDFLDKLSVQGMLSGGGGRSFAGRDFLSWIQGTLPGPRAGSLSAVDMLVVGGMEWASTKWLGVGPELPQSTYSRDFCRFWGCEKRSASPFRKKFILY